MRSRPQQGEFGQGARVTADAFLVLPGSRKSIIFVVTATDEASS